MKKADYIEGNIKIYSGDSLILLKDIKASSIDLIFADPPYFLSNGGITCSGGKMVSVNKGKWDEKDTYEKVEEFNLLWLSEAQRVLKEKKDIDFLVELESIYNSDSIWKKQATSILKKYYLQKGKSEQANKYLN